MPFGSIHTSLSTLGKRGNILTASSSHMHRAHIIPHAQGTHHMHRAHIITCTGHTSHMHRSHIITCTGHTSHMHRSHIITCATYACWDCLHSSSLERSLGQVLFTSISLQSGIMVNLWHRTDHPTQYLHYMYKKLTTFLFSAPSSPSSPNPYLSKPLLPVSIPQHSSQSLLPSLRPSSPASILSSERIPTHSHISHSCESIRGQYDMPFTIPILFKLHHS